MIFIDIFFLLLNFFVLIALLFIFLKRPITEQIPQNIKKEKKERLQLKRKKEEIESDLSFLNVEITRQDLACKRFATKINKWKKNFKIEREEALHKISELENSIMKRRGKQQEIYKIEQAYNVMLPNALEKARDELEKYFSDEKNGKNYIKNILKNISEKTILEKTVLEN